MTKKKNELYFRSINICIHTTNNLILREMLFQTNIMLLKRKRKEKREEKASHQTYITGVNQSILLIGTVIYLYICVFMNG